MTDEEIAALEAQVADLQEREQTLNGQLARERQQKREVLDEARAIAEENDALTGRGGALGERLATLEHDNRSLALQVLAVQAGAVDPEAVAVLFDWSGITDPSDRAELAEAVDELLWHRPWLRGSRLRPPNADAGTRGAPVEVPRTSRERLAEHYSERPVGR